MKVVYKRTIDEKIADAVMTAQSVLKEIECIVLDKKEMAELAEHTRWMRCTLGGPFVDGVAPLRELQYMGVKITCTEDSE